ncbi:MAG: YdeI/OmpD-associated family protein [Bacteroidales bacterium]
MPSDRMPKKDKTELPIIPFASQGIWENWLEQNHNNQDGIWIKFYKKGSGIESVSYAEALDIALCYGWIDAQLKSIDELSYKQHFTPRRKRSLWSKRNVEHVARLTTEGKMKPSGIIQVEAAKSDGRWQQAYDSSMYMALPEDFVEELTKNPKAYNFYKSLNKANQYAICYRLQTAKKPETKEKRKLEILEMLKKGEKYHL